MYGEPEYYDDEPQAAPPPAAPAEPDMASQLQELAKLKDRAFSRRKSSRRRRNRFSTSRKRRSA
jgi:hypothetical protein